MFLFCSARYKMCYLSVKRARAFTRFDMVDFTRIKRYDLILLSFGSYRPHTNNVV